MRGTIIEKSWLLEIHELYAYLFYMAGIVGGKLDRTFQIPQSE